MTEFLFTAKSFSAKFVTSGEDDIKLFDEIAVQIHKITKELVRQTWKIRGYDIDCSSDCSSCSDKPVCDDITDGIRYLSLVFLRI